MYQLFKLLSIDW